MTIFQKAFTLTFSTLMLTACGQDTSSESTTEAVTEEVTTVVADAPVYKVGVIPDFEPHAYRGDDNSLTGFNIDLTNAVAEAQGFKVEYFDKEWTPTFDSVREDKVDFIASMVTVTPERKDIVDFSTTYMISSVDAAVNAKLKDKSFDDIIADTSLTYGAMANTRYVDYPVQLGVDKAKIKQSKTSFSSVSDVFNGTADVAFADGKTLMYLKKQYPELHVIHNQEDQAEYAYVIKKGNAEMKATLDEGIEKVKSNGQYDKIYDKWFGE